MSFPRPRPAFCCYHEWYHLSSLNSHAAFNVSIACGNSTLHWSVHFSPSVTVPAPRVRIVRTPSTTVYTTTLLNFTCITMLNPEVDTPMTVTHSWRGPSGSISRYGSRPRVYSVVRVGQVYRSTILFSSGMRSSDSGSYYCTASTRSTSSSSYILTSGSVQASTYVSVGKGHFTWYPSLHTYMTGCSSLLR